MKQFLDKHGVWVVALVAAIISVISTVYYFRHGYTLAYNDAIGHIDIARRVVDFKQPGIQQIGGVWLPLPQLLMLPFVGFYRLWRDGLAGSIVSMLAFVAAATYMYRLAKLLTGSILAGFIATSLLLFNPNILYMQSTPMSEMLLIATVIAGVFYFARWLLEGNILDLVRSAFWILLSTLTRYEGWGVLVACCALIVTMAIFSPKVRARLNGQFFVFASLAAFGIGLWVLWDLVIFGNPVYWLNGPYSATSQQAALAAQGHLPTKHHLGLSFMTLLRTIRLDAGSALLIASVVALCLVLAIWIIRKTEKDRTQAIILVVLLAPALLDIFSLFAGSITINPAPHYLSGGTLWVAQHPFYCPGCRTRNYRA